MTTAIAMQTWLVGEIECMNCGRTLAHLVRDAGEAAPRLQPPPYASAVQVIVAGRRLLRCRHCKGRAFVEPLVPAAV